MRQGKHNAKVQSRMDKCGIKKAAADEGDTDNKRKAHIYIHTNTVQDQKKDKKTLIS